MGVEIDETWKKLKEGIAIVAEEMCERERMSKKQNWMNSEILSKMEERRKAKNMKDDGLYMKLKHEIQKLSREAKDKYYQDKCKELNCWIKCIAICCIRKSRNNDLEEVKCSII